MPTSELPPTFDCRRGRHCVLTLDRICVICGAQGVTDARRLPPLTNHETPTTPATPLATLEPTRSPQDLDGT
ncbi:hypothetical protein GCM10010489_32800 [Microbacterium saperdae]|uniref:Uncharacterized protein n=1 Tax=Microbacterium saperdae TaxID=69368 RepID=A0A543BJF6_9MICO|nr:hypothetical protein FB560_0486 [Microbacterium saperdae]GGM58581.1 hypothetical protein GCM10010489_32800 [Microbacterium saperdae]